MMARHARALESAERRFGVDRFTIAAVWGVESDFGKITGRSRDAIKRDFMRVAEKVTEADLEEQDAALQAASAKVTKRPRRTQAED